MKILKSLFVRSALLVASLSAVTLSTALAAGKVLTPTPLRGIWFEDSDMGQHLCLTYKLRQNGEHVPGAIVVSDVQIMKLREAHEDEILFVTKVEPATAAAWRMQALSDVFPYEAAKELKSFGLSTRNGKLYWSTPVVVDGKDTMNTDVFVRCI
ncbi:hypothetical protein [Hydrogenophaga sp. 5NK40-0174]|uniref:hypothetical protein n=1 Tax=Hydrogenophaga sp. 5NK40-0174 TaxID=3127649 RepID=UPI003101D2C2